MASDLIERLTKERDEAQSACTAWQGIYEGLEAHLMDRVNMGDEANPEAYLSILRGYVADIIRDSRAICNARWADYRRHEAALAIERERAEKAEKEIERLAAIVEERFKDTRLVSAGGRGEGFGFDLTGGPIPYIAEYLAQFMGHRDDDRPTANYSEIEVQHNELGALTLTMQRRSGKTPHQLRVEADGRATIAEASLAEAKRLLTEAREANRKLHRRAQLAEAVSQSAECVLSGWVEYLSTAKNRTAENGLFRLALGDIMHIRKRHAARFLAQEEGRPTEEPQR